MIIKDKALDPYWIISNYNGLKLMEPHGKDGKEIAAAQLNELPNLMGEVIRRKMAAIEGEVTLKEFTLNLQALQVMLQNALDITTTDAKTAVVEKEMIS